MLVVEAGVGRPNIGEEEEEGLHFRRQELKLQSQLALDVIVGADAAKREDG